MFSSNEKLYLVVREDLSPGQQAVQAVHAFREFIRCHPQVDRSWYDSSNHLALLSVKGEHELNSLLLKARRRGLKVSSFREPDRDNELTAAALEPRARTIVRGLPLALRAG